MQIIHQVDAGTVPFVAENVFIFRDQVTDALCEIPLQLVNVRDGECWREKALEALVRFRTAVEQSVYANEIYLW